MAVLSHPWRVFLLAGGIFLATLGASLGLGTLFQPSTPTPSDGLLDLGSWDWEQGGTVPLGGTWAFLPERQVTVAGWPTAGGPTYSRRIPDTRLGTPRGFLTPTGGGTYRLKVNLPGSTPALGLRISTVWAAWELEVNGTLAAQGGVLGRDQDEEHPALGGQTIPLGLAPGDRTLDLVLRVTNHHYRWGGLIEVPVLGPLAAITALKERNDSAVFLVIGALAGIALWAFFLFAFRRQDRAYLSFAVFALLAAVRVLTSGDNLLTQLLPGIGFDAFLRLSYLSLYLMIPTAALFFYRVFSEDLSRKEMTWFLALSLVPVPAVLVPSVLTLTWTLPAFVILAMGLVVYGYWAVALRTSLRRRPGSTILLAAGTVLLGFVVLNLRSEVLLARVEGAFPVGLVAFVVAQALLLAKRSTWAFGQIELLTEELKGANRSLALEAREAEEARATVETILAEKEVLLKEVHHRVKNSLQIVLSIIGLQVRRTRDPGVLAAYEGVRDRIRAISLVHDRLYGMESEQSFNLKGYLADLVDQLGGGYSRNQILFEAGPEEMQMPMDFCLEVGLVVTELVINACRHGVQPGGPGLIRVRLAVEAQARLTLRVADNGPGFPEDFSPETTRSTGYRIVSSLVSNRKGQFRIGPGPGAVIDVEIPLPP